MSEAGCFIVIEGPDGCGKTTVSALLREALLAQSERPWALVSDPSEGSVGQLIRQFLASGRPDELEALGYLFMADRMAQRASWAQPWLIADRYMLSTFAYQYGRMSKDVLLACLADRRLRPPDVVVLLDPPLELCLSRLRRRAGDAEVFESERVLAQVQQRYRTAFVEGLHGYFPGRGVGSDGNVLRLGERNALGWHRVLIPVVADEPPEAVTRKILAKLTELEARGDIHR